MLSTLFPLLVHLEDQCGEFLKSWMAYQDFKEFPNLIKYYTTIGNGTLLKQKCTTIKECTLLKEIKLLWSKNFYTTIGQYPTLYDFLAIAPKVLGLTCLNYYLTYPNKCVKPKIF